MELTSLYKAVLAALNFTASPEGLLTLNIGDNEFPATIDGKRLTLPTREVLRAGHWDNLMAFHPLSENPLRGESQVVDMLRRAVGLRISEVLTVLMHQFGHLGADVGRHKSIPPKAADVLSTMSGIDDKFVTALEKIIERQEPAGANRFIALYLKRGGTYNGQKAARVAVTSFPILEQLEDDDDTVFGVKLRKKDKIILESMFLYILPGADQPEVYNAPSTSMTAPYFDALMRAFVKVADRLNEVVSQHWDMLSERVDDPNVLLTDTSWLMNFADLSVYDGQIPPLEGNQGVPPAGEQEEVVAPRRPTPAAHAEGVFKVHKPAAAPVAPANSFRQDDDSPPWREEPVQSQPKKEGSKGPFHTEHLGEALRSPSGPFKAAVPDQYRSATEATGNSFERKPGGVVKKDEYAEWLERQRRGQYAAQVQTAPAGYGVAPMAPVTGYQVPPQNAPAWAMGPQAQAVAPGEYAGRVRGRPVNQMGYGQGQAVPAWMNPVQQPVGYGYPQTMPMNTGYGYGGGGGGGYAL